MAKRKLAPWELERKLARIKRNKRMAKYRNYLPIDGRKHGRSLTVKQANNHLQAEIASFSCPNCENNVRVDLIRLRQDCFECRKCGHVFVKENVIDDFDYDYDK